MSNIKITVEYEGAVFVHEIPTRDICESASRLHEKYGLKPVDSIRHDLELMITKFFMPRARARVDSLNDIAHALATQIVKEKKP